MNDPLMKLLATLLLLFTFSVSFGQTVEIYGGPNWTKTLAIPRPYGYNISSDDLTLKYQFGAEAGFQLKNYSFDAGISIVNYKGAFNMSSGGASYSSSKSVAYDNTKLIINFYPIKFEFKNHLEIGLGINYSRRIIANASGIGKSRQGIGLIQEYHQNPIPKDYGEKNDFGVLLKLAYTIKIKEFMLVPQLSTNYFLMEEFWLQHTWTTFIGLGLRTDISNLKRKN